jgi:hypothetical protein
MAEGPSPVLSEHPEETPVRRMGGAGPALYETLGDARFELARPIPARAYLHLGDEECEDLSEVATVATLEIKPPSIRRLANECYC